MKFTVLVAACLVALVSSIPVPEKEGLQSRALDRLVMVESDDDAALRSKRTIGILRQLFPGISQDVNPEAENQVTQDGYQAGSENNEVRVQFEDQGAAASQPGELTPLEDIEVSDDENRNKRFLNFGFGGNSAAGGGAAGGSGNFLFDIIRLVAGSGSAAQSSTPQQAGGAVDASAGRQDAVQEAVPGPVTRLFVIANRGISNLIQDLILRLAATSERIVNFKARLITSII